MEDFKLQSYQGKKIIITGGLGFIGSNLARCLSELTDSKLTIVDSLAEGMGGNRYNLHGIERPIEVCVFDMNDRERMNEIVRDIDYIFNLAGQISHIDSITNPFEDVHSNYTGHLALLEACRENNPNVRIILTSTRQVYGRGKFLPITEDHPLNPADINGINKLASEMLHLHYHHVHGIRSVILRLSNIYGPRQLLKHPRQGFIAWFIRKALKHEEIEIFGDGQQLRGLIYIDDLVNALLLSGINEENYGRIFNIGTLHTFTLQYIADTLIRLAGGGSYRFVKFPEERKLIDVGSMLLDFSSFRSVTGWVPTTSLEDGLRKTLAFYDEHKEHY